MKNIWQYCSEGNLQRKTHFKFYIDAWYLIVCQAENTPSTAAVHIKIMQQSLILKLVTQFEINSKRSERQSDQLVNEKYEVHSRCWKTT